MSARAPTGYGHNRTNSVPFSTADTAIGSPVSNGFRSSSSTQDGCEDNSLDIARAHFKNENGIKVLKDEDGDSVDGLDQLTEQDPLALEQQDPSQVKKKDDRPTWKSMPKKGQLALLIASRLAEPIAGQGLMSYMYYMLKSFDESLTDTQISEQAGWIMAAFTAAQAISAMFWGRLADHERIGRKKVLIIGLTGTAMSMMGLGFSKSFYWLMAWRVFGGLLNGNVGVIRTVIKEMIKDKKFHNRSFMLLPMTFNIGTIIGPIIGGYLSEPVSTYPWLFGPGTLLGGKNGNQLFATFPYALPNMISAFFLGSSAFSLFLFLKETHECLRDREDMGAKIRKFIWVRIFRGRDHQDYTQLSTSEDQMEMSSLAKKKEKEPVKRRRVLPFRRIWTRNVLICFLAHGFHAMHVATFQNIWPVFLSTARFDPAHPIPPNVTQTFPINFTGGLGMSPARVGNAMSIIGVIGIFAQFILYPRTSERLGITMSYRLFCTLYPFAYVIAPYIILLPSSTVPPLAANGFWIWFGIAAVLAIYVIARTFSLPSMQLLINNSCPHPSVLSTMNGFALSWGALCRTIGPALAGWLMGKGLDIGVVGLAFWALACISCLAFTVGLFVKDGSNMEIDLEAEETERLLREHNGELQLRR